MQDPDAADDNININERCKLFFSAHWRGLVLILTPLIFVFVLLPSPAPHQWTGYVILIVATYWVTECLPLPVTSFIPAVMFPLTGILSTKECLGAYMNDAVLMFLGSLMLAAAIEQSGLHKRMAYGAIGCVGYSHYKLLFGTSFVTMIISMWITNTAATTMTIPINFAILRAFEKEGIMQIYEIGSDGSERASPLTVCYFCFTTYAATIGGIGTLVGTATNLAVKGLYVTQNPTLPDQLTFPLFSAFTVPLMISLYICTYLSMVIVYLGLFRPGSKAKQRSIISESSQREARRAIERDQRALGTISYHECWVVFLFMIAILMFFTRSPQFFTGWADLLRDRFDIADPKFIQDSAVAMLIAFFMFLLPSTTICITTCCAKYRDEMANKPVKSILDWRLTNSTLPYSFMFLLGGGFAMSRAASKTGLNDRIGDFLKTLDFLPNAVIVLFIVTFVIFLTNFASNVATANILVPIFMELATKINVHPLSFCVAAGISASFCFMLPVGTPGNLIVQSMANVPTSKMIVAGIGPTISAIILTTLFTIFYAPVIWDLKY